MSDQRTLRDAYGRFPTGVVAICATVEGERVGMAVSAFVPVSLDPPLLAVCIQAASNTWPLLRRAGMLGVSILGCSQHAHARQLSAKEGDRFRELDVEEYPSGAVLLGGAQLWFECSVQNSSPAGDHEMVLLRIHSVQSHDNVGEPMIFHSSRFRELVR